ncbi:unnamed protein product, partial [Urochloa humidicola]
LPSPSTGKYKKGKGKLLVLSFCTKSGGQAEEERGRQAAMDMELEHGGDEEDRGSESSKGSLSASSDATVSSTASKLQALRFAEDLSLPSVQVVVMSANMGCSHCRQRVANVVSKMNGLLDYMVDFGKKEVTVRGKVAHTKKRRKHKNPFTSGWETKTLSWFLGCYGS